MEIDFFDMQQNKKSLATGCIEINQMDILYINVYVQLRLVIWGENWPLWGATYLG